jgi:threonine synthase
MRYISTRGASSPVDFAAATLAGLAPDGGLYVPENFFELQDIESLADIPYAQAALKVMQPFIGADVPKDTLAEILNSAYATFDTPDVTPLRKLDDNFYAMELFHGPTLAFKDVALQFLGRIFDHLLTAANSRTTIIGATSGDTGSAAIHAFKNSKRADIFILHPQGRVSDVQRRQMTTVDAPNVFNIAVDGSFDDCQDIVKAMLGNAALKNELKLSAINSINWARILAQSVYYARAAILLKRKTGRTPAFCVPTGNFGNVYAGYVAKKIGAPVGKLIVATNKNDILFRLFDGGEMKMGGITPTLSPSMDIQVSSNFERLLFDLYDRDGGRVAKAMQQFRSAGAYQLEASAMGKMKDILAAGRADDTQTLATMRRAFDHDAYVIDPHTAVGVHVAQEWRHLHPDTPVAVLSTAHPAKFPAAVEKATSVKSEVPSRLEAVFSLPENYANLPADTAAVTSFVRGRVQR